MTRLVAVVALAALAAAVASAAPARIVSAAPRTHCKHAVDVFCALESRADALAVVAAAPAAAARHALPSRHGDDAPPRHVGFARVERAAPSAPLRFHIRLPQRNLDWLEAELAKISDIHDLDNYGRYLTRQQILDKLAAPVAHRAAVVVWLTSTAAELKMPLAFEDHGDAIEVRTVAAIAERLFAVEMHVYENTDPYASVPTAIAASSRLSVPENLAHIVESVTAIADLVRGVHLGHARRQELIERAKLGKKTPPPSPSGHAQYHQTDGTIDYNTYKSYEPNNECNVVWSIRNLYNISQSHVVTHPNATQAAFSAGAGYGEKDLTAIAFMNGFVDPDVQVIGPNANEYSPTSTDAEWSMDIQMITGFGNGASTSFFLDDSNSFYYSWPHDIFQADGPLVNTISYVTSEQTIGASEVTRCDAEYMKNLAVGRTFFCGSGDNGAKGDIGGTCDGARSQLDPDYPSDSQYVVSTAASSVVNTNTPRFKGPDPIERNSTNDAPGICGYSMAVTQMCPIPKCMCSTSTEEVAPSIPNQRHGSIGFYSGGGTSVFTKMPSYQTAAVAAYLKSNVKFPPSSMFTSTNRFFPDLTAIGTYSRVLVNGTGDPYGNQMPWIVDGGTSQAGPTLGGIITLINDYRLNAGLPPVGFLHPLIYGMMATNPEVFNDLTIGTNSCVEQRNGGCRNCEGFYATTGYDAVTGIGSLNVGKFLEALKVLDAKIAAHRASK